jgi:two-component system chemotaxis sensor kinase CheA
MDMAKYRQVFVEESTEHLAEMSSALLELEKNLACGESIDLIFRMAHSIKGMAASLEYESITQVAHALEDRMQVIRRLGRVADSEELGVLFRGLETLESMVDSVRDAGQLPPADPALAAVLASCLDRASPDETPATPRATASASGAAKKKGLSPTPRLLSIIPRTSKHPNRPNRSASRPKPSTASSEPSVKSS